MNTFKKAFNKTIESMPGWEGSQLGSQYVDNVQKSINAAVESINERALKYINNPPDSLKGYLAENWHAGTFNIDVARKGRGGIHAIALDQTKGPLKDVDVRVLSDSGNVYDWQSKYYKSSLKTAKELSHPQYEEMGKIGPADQVNSDFDSIAQKASERAARMPHRDQARQLFDTAERIKDKVEAEGYESRAIDHDLQREMAKEYKRGKELDTEKYGLNTESSISISDIAHESGQAALNAAILTAVLKASPHLWHYAKELIVEGRNNKEALKDAGLAAISGATEGALRGGIAAGITASCKAGLLGSSLKNIQPAIVGAATVVAMNAVHNGIGLYQGKLTHEEFAEACLRDSFIVTMGILGASAGQALIPVPVLGAILGNFIGSTCSVIIYEGGKEIFFSIFIRADTAFIFLVKQDYTMPAAVLENCGFDLIKLEATRLDIMDFDTIELDKTDLDSLDIKVLERGLISVNTIGYT